MTRFDEDYYRRHYGDPETAVTDAESTARLARFVGSYLMYLQAPLGAVLDVGCGFGFWEAPLRELSPELEYRGVEVSAYLCEKYGWVQSSIVELDVEPADLVVCQGVLQYLDDEEAAQAIDNLAEHTLTALYVEALTRKDWEEAADQSVTDGAVHLREGAWYRERLGEHFVAAGGGLFVKRDAGVVFYELELP